MTPQYFLSTGWGSQRLRLVEVDAPTKGSGYNPSCSLLEMLIPIDYFRCLEERGSSWDRVLRFGCWTSDLT